jgi:predicted SprT family Zn-dependent metalloprotease
VIRTEPLFCTNACSHDCDRLSILYVRVDVVASGEVPATLLKVTTEPECQYCTCGSQSMRYREFNPSRTESVPDCQRCTCNHRAANISMYEHTVFSMQSAPIQPVFEIRSCAVHTFSAQGVDRSRYACRLLFRHEISPHDVVLHDVMRSARDTYSGQVVRINRLFVRRIVATGSGCTLLSLHTGVAGPIRTTPHCSSRPRRAP